MAIREAFLRRFASVAIENASFIVTGDRALLALHPFRSIEIVTPADYLRRVGLSP